MDDLNLISGKCDIFISYKRNGGETMAFTLHDRLKRCGYNVFLDYEQLTDENYIHKITMKIQECSDFLVVLSPNCMDAIVNEQQEDIGTKKEDWIAKEIRIAQAANAHIIPIILEGYRTPVRLPEDIMKAVCMNGVRFASGYFDEAYMRLLTVFLNCNLDYAEMESDTYVMQQAENGDPGYMNDMALKTEMGTPLIQENKAMALKMYLQSAKKGSRAAYYNIGDIYEKCAADPHLIGSEEYAIDSSMFLKSCPSTKVSVLSDVQLKQLLLEEAKKYYIKAGSLPPAWYRLGILAEKEHKLLEAFSYYQKAAEQGYAPAVNAMAYYYKNGIGGVPCDLAKAMELWKSIKEKLPHAAYNYAQLLMQTAASDVYLDDIEKCYRFAFFNRDSVPQAAYALAKLYEERHNKVMARHFYNLSLNAGCFLAENELRRMDREVISSRNVEKCKTDEIV